MVSKNDIIGDVLRKVKGSARVFMQHGIRCVGWGGAQYETIEQGAQIHGVNIEKLVNDLQDLDAKNNTENLN